jgi:hypothetical protein
LHRALLNAFSAERRSRKSYLHENNQCILMSTQNCPRCGGPIAPDVNFCPFCGAKLDHPFRQVSRQVNTHSLGWMVLSFLVSFLWFKINSNPVFPLGFMGGLVITFWSSDIDKALGKETYTWPSVALSVLSMLIGLFIL